MVSILKRLQNPPFGMDSSERNLISEAAATISRLTEEVERLRAALFEAGKAAGALISPNASADALANVPEQVQRLVASLRARAEAAEARVKELEEILKDAVYLAKNSNLKRGVEHLEKQLSALSRHKEG